LWAALLYAGEGAVLSHETAGELHGLVRKPAGSIHITVPESRRVRPADGLVIHRSDQPQPRDDEHEYQWGELPATLITDTLIDMAGSCRDADEVYGLVTRAFGRRDLQLGEREMLASVAARAKARWRDEVVEATVAGAAGAHSVLEFRWDRDVAEAHGLPIASKQVRFTKESGTAGFRDREYPQWRLIIELDGRESHQGEQRARDGARDLQAQRGGRETMRFGWREARYEACPSAIAVIWKLWERGWRGRPKACSPGCPVAWLLLELDSRLAANPAMRRDWLRQQAVQEAVQQAEAGQLAAKRETTRQLVKKLAQQKRDALARRRAAAKRATRA
jgi:hypothetical protein